MHKSKHITWLYWLYSILSNKILPTWNSPLSSNRICLFFTLCMKACANLDKLTPATEVAEFHVKWHCSILKKKIDRIKHLCRLLGFPQWRIFCLPCFKFLAMALLPSAPRSGPCMTAVWNVKKAKSYLTLTSASLDQNSSPSPLVCYCCQQLEGCNTCSKGKFDPKLIC